MNLKLIRLLISIILMTILVPAGTAYAAPKEPAAAAAAGKGPAYNFANLPNLKAVSAILIESDRGQVLYEKNSNEKLHISAACKIMTALVAIENAKLDARVTISKESVDAEGSALSLEVGEKYSVEDLLYGLMLTSANDAAKAIAEYVGGDIGKFVQMMNSKAQQLNMNNTRFTNPTGLYDESQYTTAYDLSLLMKYALANSDFSRIFSVPARPWMGGDGNVKILTSQNKLFWSYDGVNGGKVGYNDKARQSCITTAARNNQKFISIVLDSPENAVFEDSAQLFDFGFENYRTSILVSKGAPQKTLTIQGKELNLVSPADIYYTHPVGESYIKSFDCTVIKDLAPPISTDKIVGTAKYVLNDNTIIDINLYPDSEILPPEDFYSSLKKKVMENKEIFILVGFLVLLEAVLLLFNILKLLKKLFRLVFFVDKKS